MRHVQTLESKPNGKVFLTSDTHFYHGRIIEYCERPFRKLDGQPDIETMNETMVSRWNAVVGPEDTVIHLGDMGFGRDCTPEKLRAIRERLNGNMILIRGNHDHKPSKWLLKKDKCYDDLVVGDVYFIHVPVLVPPQPQIKTVICGHVHNQFVSIESETLGQKFITVNVGVDVWGFRPISPEEIGVALNWEKSEEK